MSEEKYIVRVQLIRADSEGKHPQYIVRSFDYEVSPTTESYQEPLFLRAVRLSEYDDLVRRIKEG